MVNAEEGGIGVFTGSTLTTLTRLTSQGVPIHAVAGQTYWIALAASGLPDFSPIELTVVKPASNGLPLGQ